MWRTRGSSSQSLSPFNYVSLLNNEHALGYVLEEDGVVNGFVLVLAGDEGRLELLDAAAPSGEDLARLLGEILQHPRCRGGRWVEASPLCSHQAAEVLAQMQAPLAYARADARELGASC
jgi:hypothetical protein